MMTLGSMGIVVCSEPLGYQACFEVLWLCFKTQNVGYIRIM